MADRTTENRIMNQFTANIDLTKAGGFSNAQTFSSQVMRALQTLVDEGKAFRQVVTDTTRGTQKVTFGFAGGSGIQEAAMASIREIVAGLPQLSEAIKISSLSRKQYTTTSERILDARTQAAMRADVLRAGGQSTFDRHTGTTTYTLPSDKVGKFHAIADESEKRYLQGDFRAAIGYSSSANIHEQARAAVERNNARTMAMQQAVKAFAKANPKSPTALALRKARRKKFTKMAKGAGGAVLAILGVAVAVLGSILKAAQETAKNTLNILTTGTKVNLSGEEVQRYANVAKVMGYSGGENPIVSSMGSLVQKFANPQSFAENIGKLVPLLRGNVTDVVPMLSSGNVDPKQAFFKVLSHVLTDVAAGNGGLLERVDMNSAFAAMLPMAAQGVSQEFADFLSNFKANVGIQPGKVYTPGMLMELFDKMGVSTIPTASQPAVAAANIGRERMDKLSADVSGASNVLLTQAVSFLGEIATMLRNFLRPFLAQIDPAGEAARNAVAVQHNREQAVQLQREISLGATSFSEQYTKLTGRKIVPVRGQSLAEATKAEYEKVQAQLNGGTYNPLVNKGAGAVTMSNFLSSNSYLFSDMKALEQLNKQLGAGVGGIMGVGSIRGATPEPSTDIVTRTYQRINAVQTQYLEMIDLKQEALKAAANEIENGRPMPKQTRMILEQLQGYPTRDDFNKEVPQSYYDLANGPIAQLGLSKIIDSIGTSGMYGTTKILPSDRLNLSSSASGLLKFEFSRDGKVFGTGEVDVSSMKLTKPIQLSGNDYLQSVTMAAAKPN
jgi:hypothetical protein